MAKMNLLEALNAALSATKNYIDDNHYTISEVDTLLDTKANASHGTHVTYSTSAPAANGTASAGSANNVARGDHVHPLQTSVSGNAGSANKVNNALKVQLNGGTTEGTNQFTFDGSGAKTVNITPASIGAAGSSHGTHVTYGGNGSASTVSRSDHTHNYAGSTSAGGAATSANKVNNNLVIKVNGGSTEGTDMFTFNGSAGKTINLTAASLGAPASHNHDDRYYTETEIDAEFVEVRNEIDTVVAGYEGLVGAEKDRAMDAEAELQTAINNEVTRAAAAEAKALTDAKAYADQKVAGILDSAPEALNTLNELAAALGDDPNFATTIATQIGGKADAQHGNHVPATQTANNAVFLRNDNTWATVTPDNIGAAKASHGTHVTFDSTNKPKVAGTAAFGTSTNVARADHVHPAQTSVSGNAGTATKFASAQSVALTGDVTGSASSQAGWSVATTLSNSGVTAGSYGPAENASPGHGKTFTVPYITVDAKGRVTSAATQTITLPTDNNTTYTNEKLGNGYGTCETAEATTAKVVTFSNYSLVKNGYVSVKFTYAVPASATMNINNKGAKNIFYKGAAIVAGVIKAGDIATFIYDGTQYQLVAIDRWQADTAGSIKGLSVSGKVITYTRNDGTTGTITTQDTDTKYTHPSDGANTGSFGNSANQTPGYGATFNVPYITVNAAGHVTAIKNTTVKIPASDKVTVTNNLTSTSTSAALSAAQGKALNDNKADKVEDTELQALLVEIFGSAAE